jgi:hypothetical protein
MLVALRSEPVAKAQELRLVDRRQHGDHRNLDDLMLQCNCRPPLGCISSAISARYAPVWTRACRSSGSLNLHRDGLPPSTSCRSPGAPVIASQRHALGATSRVPFLLSKLPDASLARSAGAPSSTYSTPFLRGVRIPEHQDRWCTSIRSKDKYIFATSSLRCSRAGAGLNDVSPRIT